MTDKRFFDVIIIGGSYAGLSAAMALGRSMREVLIIDNGQPCNSQTPYSHNFITQDGETPGAITEKAKTQALKYQTVNFHKATAISARKEDSLFFVNTSTGEEFRAQKLILASGVKDQLPNIKGFSDCWGISVVHCPYCHGYEFKDKKTGIIANGEKAYHLASLINNLTNNITILTSGTTDFSAEQLSKLDAHDIKLRDAKITEILHEQGQVKGVIFEDGELVHFDALYAVVDFTQHSDIPASLGCEFLEQGHIKVDSHQKTSVQGVFACGDNSNMMRSVANAVASGNLAGAIVNKELTDERF